MITLLTLLAILLVVIIAIVVFVVLGGITVIFSYLDVIIAVLLIYWIIRHFMNKRK